MEKNPKGRAKDKISGKETARRGLQTPARLTIPSSIWNRKVPNKTAGM